MSQVTRPLPPSRTGVAAARPAATPWLVAGSALVALTGIYLLLVRTAPGQRLDDRAMTSAAAVAERAGWADEAALLLAWIGSGVPLLLGLGLVVTTVLARGGRAGLAVALTGLSVPVVAQVLKSTLERPALLPEALANSFPSGHVAAVAGLVAALAVALPTVLRSAGVLLIGVPLVGAVGAATLALAWHRPSDVVGAVALAVAAAALGRRAAGGRSGPA